MPQYFAAAVARTPHGWVGSELDLDGVDDLDTLAELVRDAAGGEASGPGLLFLEEDDEYVGLLRIDPDREPRAFLSDVRAAHSSELAGLLHEDAEPVVLDEEEETGSHRPEAEPAGDATLLADLGVPTAELLALCAEEGMLPADVITALAERLGCLEVLEELREG